MPFLLKTHGVNQNLYYCANTNFKGSICQNIKAVDLCIYAQLILFLFFSIKQPENIPTHPIVKLDL